MFEAVITHQKYCYQFTCIVYHSAVNVYNVKTIRYNYKFGITIIKGKEHNCITKKNYSMLKKKRYLFFSFFQGDSIWNFKATDQHQRKTFFPKVLLK